MKSAHNKKGDRRSLDMQLRESMSIEELTINVKTLKKDMSYLIEFMKSQLGLLPAESTEEEKHVTQKRGFLAGKIKTLSEVEKNILKEPSDDFDSIDSVQFVRILLTYKNIFTDILVDGRFIDPKNKGVISEDERAVSKATFTIITSDNPKAILAAVDQLVETHFTNALTAALDRMVQEKNFSALSSMKDFTKKHYGIADQVAAIKLKEVFDKLFSAEEDERLREAFYTAVIDPTKEKNIMALRESYGHEEQEEGLEINEGEESELDYDNVEFTEENAEEFIASTQLHKERNEQDDSASEIEDNDNQQEKEDAIMEQQELRSPIDILSKPKGQVDTDTHKRESGEKILQENEELKRRVVEVELKLIEAEKALLEKKEPVPVISLSSTSVPVPASVLPLAVPPENLGNMQDLAYCIDKIILPTLKEKDKKSAGLEQRIAELNKVCKDLNKGKTDPEEVKKLEYEVRTFLKDYCLSYINKMHQNKVDSSLIKVMSTYYKAFLSEEKITKKIVDEIQVIDKIAHDSKAKNDSYFTDKDFSIILAALQAEGMSNNGWKIDNKKLKDIKTDRATEFTVPLMLEKPGRRLLWSNNQSVSLKFLKQSDGKIQVINPPKKGDIVSSLIQRIQDSIANPEKTRTLIDENNNPERKAQRKNK